MPDRRFVIAAVLAATLPAAACLDSPLDQSGPRTTVIVTPAAVLFEALGETRQLGAEARDENNQLVTGVVFAWGSTDTTVATVSSDGLVTAVANGTTSIAATTGQASGAASVTVTQRPTHVDVSPQDPTLAVSSTLQLTFVIRDRNDNQVVGLFPGSWSSSDDAVATVSGTGLVTGVAQGQADVIYDITLAAGSTTVTVTP